MAYDEGIDWSHYDDRDNYERAEESGNLIAWFDDARRWGPWSKAEEAEAVEKAESKGFPQRRRGESEVEFRARPRRSYNPETGAYQ